MFLRSMLLPAVVCVARLALAAGTLPARDTAPPPAADMHWGSYTRVTIDGHVPLVETGVRPVPAAITAAAYLSAFVGLHVYQENAWWKRDRGPFHFEEDWPENLQNDKFGHFYGAYMMSYASREALLES